MEEEFTLGHSRRKDRYVRVALEGEARPRWKIERQRVDIGRGRNVHYAYCDIQQKHRVAN